MHSSAIGQLGWRTWTWPVLLAGWLLLSWGLAQSGPADEAGAEQNSRPARRLDPAAWGSDHVGQELPEFVESGECLFCHRNDVGPSWSRNGHSQTIRDATAELPAVRALAALPATKERASEATLVMGGSRANRFLKRGERFGHLDLLSAAALAIPGRGGRFRIADAEGAHWDADAFNRRCAGCHTTALDPEAQTFQTVSLDCYVCHGDAPLEHANDTKLMPLAVARKDSPAAVISMCGQCHVRFGKSKSTGLPWANNFVAGDNLFRDLEFDFDLVDRPDMNPADGHVLDNIRDVALYGREELTCLSCHEVHPGTTVKHRALAENAELAKHKSCTWCHEPGRPWREHKQYEVHSRRCEY